MGSIQSDIECPRCKKEDCFKELNYKTGEEVTHCKHCGYYYMFAYERDAEGNFMKKDKAGEDSPVNYVSKEIHHESPFGTYELRFINGGGETGTLVNEEEYLNLLKAFVDVDKSKVQRFAISRLIDGKIEVEVIYPKE